MHYEPEYRQIEKEIENSFYSIAVVLQQIDETMELMQQTDKDKIIIDETSNLSMNDLITLIRDSIAFITKENDKIRRNIHIRCNYK